MSLDNVIDIVISQQTQTVARQAFGYGLILGVHTHGLSRVMWFDQATWSADAIAAGFTTDDPIYKALSDDFRANPAPKRACVGRQIAATQDVVIDTATEGTVYQIKIQGSTPGTWTTCSHTATAGQTVGDIATALAAAIQASVEHTGNIVDGSVVSTSHVRIAPHGTAAFMVALGTGSTKMTLQLPVTTEDADAALAACLLVDKDWYGVITCDRTTAQVKLATAWVQANTRIMMNASADANTVDQDLDTDTTSLAKDNKDKAQSRVAMLYSGVAATRYPDATWLGVLFAKDPGKINPAHKSLPGITVDVLTPTQETNAHNKYCSTYTTIGGVNVTEEGWNGAGAWIDAIRDVDWLTSLIKSDMWSHMVRVDKIPFTQPGIDSVLADLRGSLDKATDDGKTGGVLAPFDATLGDYVTAPKVSEVSAADRAARRLATLTFQRRLAGALNHIVVRGVVTV